MTVPDPEIFEKLAAFYLGRHFDLDSGQPRDELLMYDAKDLCTHAMCVGMTGSGKTGLCISLLEEAALDGIPAICVDPKGDLANLMLTFPELRPADFQPWLEPGEAERQGMTVEALAAATAEQWRRGLASWGQTPERIGNLKKAVDVAIYTPGSTIGLPLTVLKNFDAPPPEVCDDPELLGERITGAVSGLLTLMGIQADPMSSPEHILLSSILSHQWKAGKHVGIAQLIRLIQSPPLTRVGVVDLDSFMSPTERVNLAMRLNNLLASPAFASWLQGESLSIKRLLHTAEGKPRLTILSIAHMNDSERMFFVTILLNELLAWMRTQTGTNSLRAIFYMDEVAGFFPPVSNPPSKPPMLTLLKQARAFGLGITLATQNPVDLDYKGLSNIGTWFLGRLQTERDKARVLEGLEGAASQSGQGFDRGKTERILAGLGKRVFLMNNVHDGFATIFQSRWAMSFLAGPLARGQISKLMADRKESSADPETVDSIERPAPAASDTIDEPLRPAIPAGIAERFVTANWEPSPGAKRIYRPALYGTASLHFIRKTADLDQWQDARRIVPCHQGFPAALWESSESLPAEVDLLSEPEPGFRFAPLPDELLNRGKYRSYRAQLKDYLYRHSSVTLYQTTQVKGFAPLGDKADALAHFQHRLHELRDEEIESLRDKHQAKVDAWMKRRQTAEERLARETAQSRTSMISAGASVLSALVGNFLGGRRTGMTTVARGVGYATQQGGDVRRAEEAIRRLDDDRQALESELEQDLAALHKKFDTDAIELQETKVAPRKSDLNVEEPMILWTPWQVDGAGIASPLF